MSEELGIRNEELRGKPRSRKIYKIYKISPKAGKKKKRLTETRPPRKRQIYKIYEIS
jgi:hypothetical protein